MKPETTISFVNDWGGSIDSVLDSLRYYTPGHDNRWNDLKAVSNPADADYLIALNGLSQSRPAGRRRGIRQFISTIRRTLSGKQTPAEDTPVPPDDTESVVPAGRFRSVVAPSARAAISSHPRKVYMQMEPPEIRTPLANPEDFIFFGSYERHHHVANWHLKLPFKELESLQQPEEFKPLSAVISGKTATEAQRRRLELTQEVSTLIHGMHIYGKGLSEEAFGKAWRGALNYNGHCKFRGLYGYRYSLAFENASHANYFTEKLVDCFLSWSKPVYWGCPNIKAYFPEESFVYVDLFNPDTPKIIAEEIRKPVDYDALREARRLVLHRYNIWPSIERIIEEVQRD